jgi:outer membrane receptor protein involved in Fe transport
MKDICAFNDTFLDNHCPIEIIQLMKHLYIILSLTFFSVLANAQNMPQRAAGAGAGMNMGRFYGKIVDNAKKGIDGATVQLKLSKFDPATKKVSETTAGTMITASNGDFNFENLAIMGNYKLIVSGIGYKKFEKQISFNIKMTPGQNMQDMMAMLDKDLGNIKLEESTNDLQTVTVTASKPQFEMGIDRKVFNVEKSLTSTGQTAVEVMKNIPNLNVDIDGNVTMRNASPTILIDNRPTTLTLDQIPADIIEKVEIITNPSAKYEATGGNAGILNIVLKKNRKNGYNGGIRTGVDMRGKFNGGTDLNLRDSKFNFSLNAMINGRKSIGVGETSRTLLGTTLPTSTTSINNSENNGSFNFFRAGLDYLPDNRNTFSLYSNIVKGSFNSTGTQTIDSSIGTRTSQYGLNNNGHFEFLNKGAQLSYKHLFAEPGHEISADVNYNAAENNNHSDIISTILNQSTIGKGNTSNYTTSIDYAKPIKNDGKFELGGRFNYRDEFNNRDQYRNNTLLSAISKQYDYTEKVFAAYTNISWKAKQFSYQLGLRAESREYNGSVYNIYSSATPDPPFKASYPISLFPSAFITYKKSDKEDFNFNYSKRIQPPNFFQLLPFPDYGDPQNITIGNPKLKPQFTHSAEISYNNAYTKGSNFLATAYFKYSTDLITNYIYKDVNKASANGDSAYFSSSINANTATTYGLELSNKTAITKWWDMNLSFNLFSSSIQATIPGQNVDNSLVSWFSKINNTIKLGKGWSYQLSGQYQAKTILPPGGNSRNQGGGMMGGPGGGFFGPQSTAQGYNLPFYDFDMAIKKDWTLKGGKTASLSFSVNDVFKTRENKTFSQSQYFIQNSLRIRDQQLFRVNFSYRFGKFDMNLLRRKNNKMEDGGGMDQMPQQ